MSAMSAASSSCNLRRSSLPEGVHLAKRVGLDAKINKGMGRSLDLSDTVACFAVSMHCRDVMLHGQGTETLWASSTFGSMRYWAS